MIEDTASCDIAGPAEAVRPVLGDLERLPIWHPCIAGARGAAGVGGEAVLP